MVQSRDFLVFCVRRMPCAGVSLNAFLPVSRLRCNDAFIPLMRISVLIAFLKHFRLRGRFCKPELADLNIIAGVGIAVKEVKADAI